MAKVECDDSLPFEVECKLQFMLADLLFQELFELYAPNEIQVDIKWLFATVAFYSFTCGCGTSRWRDIKTRGVIVGVSKTING